MMPAQDHLSELRTFIAGASRASTKFNPLELARTALSLLQTFPATRNAVLEYFCTLFDSAVAKYIMQIESDLEAVNGAGSTNNNQEEATIAEIHSVLCSFVKANPEAWAPIISTWSLELLGELSSRYAGRAGITATSTLNDSLQLWMSCIATRTLVDITTQCLACHRDSQACINALLDTSVLHSPHFDWAVAHVGSCFPRTVVTRVLRCGLEVFARHGTETQQAHDKLCSVVAILGHLAAGHLDEIRQAVAQLFQASVEMNSDEENLLEREATVPFLLQLASLSSTLLSAITSEILDTLDGAMLERMRLTAPLWCRYLGGTRVALLSLLVSLAMGCHRGGPRIVQLLLESASVGGHPDIQFTAREILEMLLQELNQMLRVTSTVAIPLLVSIKREITAIQPLLLSTDPLRLYTAIRLVGLVGYHSPADAITSARYLLLNAASVEQLAALVRLCSQLSTEQLAQTVQQAMRCRDDDSTLLWQNLDTLLRWECRGCAVALSCTSAVRSNLHEACHLLAGCSQPALAHWVARVIDLAATETSLRRASVEQSLRLTSATVKYFFLCVEQPASFSRTRGVNVCYRLLERVSTQVPAARSLAIGELARLALFGEEARHFGAAQAAQPGATTAHNSLDQRLMNEIHKLGTGNMLTHRMSSTFLIGSFDCRRNASQQVCLPREDATDNTHLLIQAIKSCATDVISNGDSETRVISLDAITMLSLTLVQLISSDRMYNGLPWPDEEFCKVTVERDLGIRRILDGSPLAWHLLTLVAAHPPCLCYCSVVLRALAATLLAQWAAQHDAPALRDTTQHLVEVMALGQLLPPPLSAIREVIPHVKPVEIMHLLRACVWNYMRDNVPSPALFSREQSGGATWRADPTPPARHHTDTLRFIMQANIAQLGSLYAQLFAADKMEH